MTPASVILAFLASNDESTRRLLDVIYGVYLRFMFGVPRKTWWQARAMTGNGFASFFCLIMTGDFTLIDQCTLRVECKITNQLPRTMTLRVT